MNYKPQDYHDAVYEIGPAAGQWQDKPHRLLIMAKEDLVELTADNARLRAALEAIVTQTACPDGRSAAHIMRVRARAALIAKAVITEGK